MQRSIAGSIPAMALMLAIGAFSLPANAQGQGGAGESEPVWLESLITETPQQGFALAVTLARRAVRTTQPDVEVLRELRPVYATDADSLIAVSSVVAIHFQTIAAANDYWRSSSSSSDAESARD